MIFSPPIHSKFSIEKAYQTFVQVMSNIQYLEEKKQPGSIETDPWLLQIIYYNEVDELRHTQTAINNEIIELYKVGGSLGCWDSLFLRSELTVLTCHLFPIKQETEKIDKKRAETCQMLMKNAILITKHKFTKILNDVEVSLKTFDTVNTPTQDWGLFSQENGLEKDKDQLLQTLPKVFYSSKFKSAFQSSAIVRYGEMEVSSVWGWSKYTFYITK